MTPMTRALTGSHLVFNLDRRITDLRQDESYVATGRLGSTLVKDGPLRLTLTVLRAGTSAGTHHAAEPMVRQVLEGRLRYRVGSEVHTLVAGEVLFFGPGHAQDIAALEDTALLLRITRTTEQG